MSKVTYTGQQVIEDGYVPFTFEDAELLIWKAIKHYKGPIYSIIAVQESGIVS